MKNKLLIFLVNACNYHKRKNANIISTYLYAYLAKLSSIKRLDDRDAHYSILFSLILSEF